MRRSQRIRAQLDGLALKLAAKPYTWYALTFESILIAVVTEPCLHEHLYLGNPRPKFNVA